MWGDPTLRNTRLSAPNFPKGSQERAATVQSLNCILQPELYCYGAVMHSPSYSSFPSCFLDLGKEEKFTDSETVKDCMLAVVNEVINGGCG